MSVVYGWTDQLYSLLRECMRNAAVKQYIRRCDIYVRRNGIGIYDASAVCAD